jgi:Putative MetA-pathway of phenol degradation
MPARGILRVAAFAALLLGAAPAAADDLRPLCPDRPGKGTSPCTLDPGHFQVEVDAIDGIFQRADGVTSDTYIAVNPTLKYGIGDTVDIEASFAPYISQRTHDAASDTTLNGNGDLYLRAKWNFMAGDGPLAAVVEPFVKFATATRGLGDGAMEEGVVLPLAYDLGNGWSLASTPEIDLLLNGSGSGRHADAIDVVGVGRALDDGVSLGVEVWTSQDFDPAGTRAQYSFDLDAAWQPKSDADLQLDAGLNLGLNRNTPGAEVYFGVSRRF